MKFLQTDQLVSDSIEFRTRHDFTKKEVQALVDEVANEPYLGKGIYKKNPDTFVMIVYQGKLVGLATPRKEADGRIRPGYVYIKPAYRKKGIAKKFIKVYLAGKRARVWIEDSNVPSQALYHSCGFKKSGKSFHDSGETYHEYLKD